MLINAILAQKIFSRKQIYKTFHKKMFSYFKRLNYLYIKKVAR
ncbi:hypothetical protein SanJ4206_0502c [Streptococcus anginosus]|nr:hypothetical protein SanJ4206_0502c [Streptococcus anginosus]